MVGIVVPVAQQPFQPRRAHQVPQTVPQFGILVLGAEPTQENTGSGAQAVVNIPSAAGPGARQNVVPQVQTGERQVRIRRFHVLGAAVVLVEVRRPDETQFPRKKPLPESTAVVLDVVLHQRVEARAQGQRDVPRRRGPLGDQVHTAADRIALHVRRQDLGDFDGTHQIGGNRVERDLPAGVLRGPDALAVDGSGAQPGLGAADQHVAPLALVALHNNAGNALDRLGGVGIGKAANLVGGDQIDEVDRVLLVVQRPRLPHQFRIPGYRHGCGQGGNRKHGVPDGSPAGWNHHVRRRRLETQIRRGQLGCARPDALQCESSGVIADGTYALAFDSDFDAGQCRFPRGFRDREAVRRTGCGSGGQSSPCAEYGNGTVTIC